MTPVTMAEVVAAVEHIRAIAGDDEAAHAEEDAIRERVLEAALYGQGSKDRLAAMARVALSTSTIEFARWYA